MAVVIEMFSDHGGLGPGCDAVHRIPVEVACWLGGVSAHQPVGVNLEYVESAHDGPTSASWRRSYSPLPELTSRPEEVSTIVAMIDWKITRPNCSDVARSNAIFCLQK